MTRQKSVATEIVMQVAKRENIEPTALDTRLYDVTDRDALEALIAGQDHRESQSWKTVS